MPNWCEGNMRLRGRPEAILDFLKNELTCVGYKHGLMEVVERVPEFEDEYGLIKLKFPEDMKGLFFKSIYIQGTRRNFVKDDEMSIDVDQDEDVTIAYIPDFKAAWDIDPEPYVQKSKKYGIDIKIFGFEMGMQFERIVEVVQGELVRNQTIEHNDWRWDSAFPMLGG